MISNNKIPGVLYSQAPTSEPVPLVLDSPHSGTDYPEDFGYAAPIADLRKAEDTFVDELFGAAPDKGAALIAALFPRSYIDANRALVDIDPALLAEPWPEPHTISEKSERGGGLIWRVYHTGQPIYDRLLSLEEARARIEKYWRPYHETLRSGLDAVMDRFGRVYHINCHSMPRLSNVMSKEKPGTLRPEFCLGDLRGTSCSQAFTEFVKTKLESFGHQVAVNAPYAGVELVRAYSDPAAGRHSLQVEIRRDLYMDEDTFEKTADFEPLQRNLTDLVAAVADYARDATG